MKSELIEMKNRVISNDKAFDITISCWEDYQMILIILMANQLKLDDYKPPMNVIVNHEVHGLFSTTTTTKTSFIRSNRGTPFAKTTKSVPSIERMKN